MSEELNDEGVPVGAEQSPAEVVESEIISDFVDAEVLPPEVQTGSPIFMEAEIVVPQGKENTEANQLVVVAKRKKETAADQELVEKAIQEITNIASRHFTNAMIEVGQYLINEFFYGDIELVKQRKGKLKSLNQVTKQLGQSGDKNYSRTWIYNSIDLVLESKALESVHSYGRLSNGCKVLLIPVKDEKQKIKLIEKAAKENLSVSKLKELINQGKPQKQKNFVTFLKKVKSVQSKSVEDIFKEFNAINLTKEEYEELKKTIQIQTDKYNKQRLTIAVTLSKYSEIKEEIIKYSSMI